MAIAKKRRLLSRPPVERMMFIHEELRRNTFPNCTRLKQQLEVKAGRTILRDIDFMRDRMRLPIAYDETRHGYYYTRPVDHFPGIALSESELFSILVAQKAVANYQGTPFHRPLLSAFNKLSAQLGKDAVLHLQGLGEVMDIRLAGPEILDEENFQIVLRAVQQNRPLQFSYRKQAARAIEARRIHPYELVCASSRWYVIGHDTLRNAMRSFVLSRMSNTEILPGRFTRPADFKIEDYLSGSFGIFKGKDDYEVVIELDHWAADILRGRRWHPSQRVDEVAGGQMRVTFQLDNLEEIEQWVLSWGAHAMVVRPKALADRVTTAAAAIVKRYAQDSHRGESARQKELRLKNR